MNKLVITLLICTLVNVAYPTPKEIVVIRHADKMVQQNHGSALSPTGYMRAIKFAFYFLDKFGKPDAIIATNPDNSIQYSRSIRELQTVAPLESLIEEKYPTAYYEIDHPYPAIEYKKLAKYVLSDKKFNDKLVLICWDHYAIPFLLKALGIKEALAPWGKYDYDSVYILHFRQNKLTGYEVLHNQYAVPNTLSWGFFNNLVTDSTKTST